MGLENWIDIEPLGEGGQGIVTLVKPNRPTEDPLQEIVTSLKYLHGSMESHKRPPMMQRLSKALAAFTQGDYVRGAKKVLRKADEESRARLALETQVYESASSPHLLKILDKSLPPGEWIITEYQPNGTLETRLTRYRGDAISALRAIRPLVEVLAEMHRQGFVHRDFKPGNIFIGRQQHFVLGDAGLAFYMGDTERRTQTYESVGTKDYMPAWAYGRRLKSIDPTFDVFSAGKVLWAMVAGERTCPLWYVRDREFDLKTRFPGRNEIRWLNNLFDKCIVEREEAMRIRNGAELLGEIDIILRASHLNAVPPGEVLTDLSCKACFVGVYKKDNSGHKGDIVDPQGTCLRCDACGHLNFFARD